MAFGKKRFKIMAFKKKIQAQAKAELKTPLNPSAVAAEEDEFEENPGGKHLELDDNNKTLNYGQNGRPLFISSATLTDLIRRDVNMYCKYSKEKLEALLPEGLPEGIVKEFEDSMRSALLVRQSFLDLRDHFRRKVDPAISQIYGKPPKAQKQIVLDGPRSSGKSIALAMLVQCFVRSGRKVMEAWWIFLQEPEYWTPVQAARILQDFLKYNEAHLQKLPCQIYDHVPLGEGGWMKGVDSMEGSTLYDLIQIGLSYSHAAVGTVELCIVKDIPVLIAIDQVNAFRSMMHNDMMVGSFSHSTAVGKLRQDLPKDARINLARYSLDDAATVSHYYLRYILSHWEAENGAFSEEGWKKVFYLANGNGSEMRWLFPFPLMQAGIVVN